MRLVAALLTCSLCCPMANAKVYATCPDEATQKLGGGWFDAAAVEKCLRIDDDLKACEQERNFVNERLGLQGQEIADYGALELNLDGQIRALQVQLQDSEVEADDLTQSINAWYHNPWFMGALGFAIGVVGTGAAVILVRQQH